MRSSAEVRRRKTQRRRGESWGTVVLVAARVSAGSRGVNDNSDRGGAYRTDDESHFDSPWGPEHERVGCIWAGGGLFLGASYLRHRHDCLCYLHGGAVVLLDAAVVAAVGEIDHQADGEPDNEAGPIDPAEFVHHVAVEEDAEDRNQRHPRSAEGAVLAWIRAAKDEYGDADDDESEKRADIHHAADVVDGNCTADEGGEDADENRVLVRRAEFRMNRGEEFPWEQAVVGHGVEHARLADKHDEHDAGKSGESARGD